MQKGLCVRFRHWECLHERVVEQRPSPWSLQCVVDEILDTPLPDVVPLRRSRVADRRFGQKAKVLRTPFKFRLLRRGGEQQCAVSIVTRACLELSGDRVFSPLAWLLGAVSAISRSEPHVHCCRESAARVCKCMIRHMPWSEQEGASPFYLRLVIPGSWWWRDVWCGWTKPGKQTRVDYPQIHDQAQEQLWGVGDHTTFTRRKYNKEKTKIHKRPQGTMSRTRRQI